MNKTFVKLTAITVFTAMVGVIGFNYYSTRLVFVPPKLKFNDVDNDVDNDNEDKSKKNKLFYVKNKDFKVSVMEIHPDVIKSEKLIIYSHGNASDIFENENNLIKLSNLYHCVIVCYDYCGYGLTQPKITSVENCFECLDSVIKYYIGDLNSENEETKIYDINDIILCGYSLGTGVTINYVHKTNWINDIILIAPFKSITRVLYDHFIMDILNFKHPFYSIYKIKNINCKIKIIHGKKDKLIPISHSIDLHNEIIDKHYELDIIENCNHGNILKYLSSIKNKDIKKILKNKII